MKKPRHISRELILHTRPDCAQYASARSCFFTTKKRSELLKTKLNCGTNEYGFTFIASFKKIGGRVIALFTPGISTYDEDKKTLDFTPSSNLTSSLWLEAKPIGS